MFLFFPRTSNVARDIKRIALAFFAIAYLIVAAVDALAWPPTYGAEFTFTNSKILQAQKQHGGTVVNNAESEAHRDMMGEILRERCKLSGECKIKILKNKYGVEMVRVTYKEGFWFQIATDPAVVEIQAKAATREEYLKYKEILERDIFEVAREVGMEPSEIGVGGGHIHIGATSALDKDARLFRNFLVDFVNHPEIGTGILANDHYNAPPVMVLSDKQIDAFKKIINKFDNGEIKTIFALAKELQDKVYFETPTGWDPPKKYQAFNVTRIVNNRTPVEEKTIEIRSIRPQQSIEDFIKQITLWEKRLELLKSQEGLVEVGHFKEMFMNLAHAPRTEREAERRFYFYVTEAGLNWDDYKKWANNVAVEDLKLNENCSGSLKVVLYRPKLKMERAPLSVSRATPLPRSEASSSPDTGAKKDWLIIRGIKSIFSLFE